MGSRLGWYDRKLWQGRSDVWCLAHGRRKVSCRFCPHLAFLSFIYPWIQARTVDPYGWPRYVLLLKLLEHWDTKRVKRFTWQHCPRQGRYVEVHFCHKKAPDLLPKHFLGVHWSAVDGNIFSILRTFSKSRIDYGWSAVWRVVFAVCVSWTGGGCGFNGVLSLPC